MTIWRGQQVLRDICEALDGPRCWAVMVIGFDDYSWQYGIVEIEKKKQEEIEEFAGKLVRYHLQFRGIFPTFVKLKYTTSREVRLTNVLISLPLGEET